MRTEGVLPAAGYRPLDTAAIGLRHVPLSGGATCRQCQTVESESQKNRFSNEKVAKTGVGESERAGKGAQIAQLRDCR